RSATSSRSTASISSASRPRSRNWPTSSPANGDTAVPANDARSSGGSDMPASFDVALAVWLKVEGGASADAGGTQSGIIQATYDSWRRKHGQPPRPVAQITPTETSQLLQQEYWQALNCANLPQGWAMFVLVESGNLPWRDA